MEVETTVSDDVITREGQNPSRESHYVSPEIAAAQAGETVVFNRDPKPADEDTNDTDDA